MKRRTRLIVFAAVFVAVCALYLLASNVQSDTAQSASSSNSQPAVTVRQPESVHSLCFTYNGQTVSLTKNSDGSWSYTDENFPVSTAAAEKLAQALTDIPVASAVEQPLELYEYGLDDPVCRIEATDDEDAVYTYAVGDLNSLTDTNYFCTDGDDGVYLVDNSFAAVFSVSLFDLLQNDTLPDMVQITAYRAENRDREDLLLTAYDTDPGYSYRDTCTWYQTVNGTPLAADTTQVQSLFTKLTGLTLTDCAAYGVSESGLAAYGLLTPACTLTVQYTDSDAAAQTLTLLLGDYNGTKCYCMLQGSTLVYQIDGTLADSLQYTGYESLCPQTLCEIDWTKVTALTFTDGGTAGTAALSSQTGSDGDTVYTLTRADGTAADTDAAADWITDFSAVQAQTYSGTGEENLPEQWSLCITRAIDHDAVLTLHFARYSSAQVLVTFDGQGSYLVSYTDASSLYTQLQTLFA